MTQKAKCSRCGVEKPTSELNGYDPINNDYSRAYCIRIAQCDSQEAKATLNKVFDALDGEHKARRMDNFEINKRIAEIENYSFEISEKPVGGESVKYVRVRELTPNQKSIYFDFQPATEWVHGGQLIQDYQIELVCNGIDVWSAKCVFMSTWQQAETPLKAAMMAVIHLHKQ